MTQTLNSAFQSLSLKIAGYEGYDAIHQRKESDRRVRQFLISQIKSILDSLIDIPKAEQAKDQARLSDLATSTKRKLITINQSLNDPTYSGSSFFTLENLATKRLERIYRSEDAMLSELFGVAEEVFSLKNKALLKTVIEDHFLHIKDFIDNFNQVLFERESLMIGNE